MNPAEFVALFVYETIKSHNNIPNTAGTSNAITSNNINLRKHFSLSFLKTGALIKNGTAYRQAIGNAHKTRQKNGLPISMAKDTTKYIVVIITAYIALIIKAFLEYITFIIYRFGGLQNA